MDHLLPFSLQRILDPRAVAYFDERACLSPTPQRHTPSYYHIVFVACTCGRIRMQRRISPGQSVRRDKRKPSKTRDSYELSRVKRIHMVRSRGLTTPFSLIISVGRGTGGDFEDKIIPAVEEYMSLEGKRRRKQTDQVKKIRL